MSDRLYNILFLCTGNSARSLMAEALMGSLGKGRFRAYSAGSSPTGKVNPFAMELIRTTDYPVEQLRSKSWDEFAGTDAPPMDFIVTVCDNTAGEVCPIWPGRPISAHWGFEDPAALQGSDDEKRRVFKRVFHEILGRVQIFLSLPLATLDRTAMKHEMDQIGQAGERAPS